jgi:hypothetical protein
MKYPKKITGCYKLNLSDFTLKPTFMLSDIDDIKIEMIWIEDGIAKILFENGYIQLLAIRYDESENMYIVDYDHITHCFQVQASLAGVHEHVDIKLFIDFGEIAKEGH